MKLEHISKPKIVDFLRVCDRKHWVFPRIRYASVRSKPTLLRDIRQHFEECTTPEGRLRLVPRRKTVRCPDVQYDPVTKLFRFDGQTIDLPKEAKPEFRIIPGPVVVHFGMWTAREAQPSSCVVPVGRSQTPHTRSDPGSSAQSPPSSSSPRTPSSGPSCPLSWGKKNKAGSPDSAVLSC